MHRMSLSGRQPVPQAADKHGDVGALAAAVGVKLVEDQEFEVFAIADRPLVEFVLPGQQQFEHHEVGQQDVRRVVGDAPALLLVFLAGVALVGDAVRLRDILEIAVEFADLAVGQRVHRIDDDGSRPPAGDPPAALAGRRR